MKNGIVVIAELSGEVGDRIAAIQREFDPRMAKESPPHVTLVGSSGVGPMRADTPLEALRNALEPITADTPPITVRFGPAMRFMQTDIIVLPLDPHGTLRALHERIATSGLHFERPRFSFSPHCTLSFYRMLTPARARTLLAVRIEEPVLIERLRCLRTERLGQPQNVLELALGGGGVVR